MKFTLLGTGTSQGIPVIGCNCSTCLSEDIRDKRLRCSAYIHDDHHGILIDAGPDFRTQALLHSIKKVDAVFLTHEHNDHVAGLDDLRPFMFRSGKPMKIYAEERVLNDIKRRYGYAFIEQPYPGAPSFELLPIIPGQSFQIGSINLEAIRVLHGGLPILAYVVQKQLAYLTDTNEVPLETQRVIQGIPILILDALRRKSHHSHFSLDEAIEVAASIRAGQTFLIHLSHLMGPTREWEIALPRNVFPSYDNLTFDLHTD